MRTPHPSPASGPRDPGTARPVRRGRTRATATVTVAVALTAAIGVAASPADAQAPPPPKAPHVLQTDAEGYISHLGPVRVNTRTSNLSNAYRAFGRPSTSATRDNVRRVRWKAAGVSILAVTFGACRRPRACSTKELLVQSARVTGPRWQTVAGLKVGDAATRIPELYPKKKAPADGSGNVVLTTAFTQIGDPRNIPIVTARVRGGTVSGFDVWVGAAGD